MNGHSPRGARSRPAKRGAAKRAPEAAQKRSAAGPKNGKRGAEAKRERILDAAVRVFAQEGFYNAKVSQIAHAAGVADGTIYLYFKSKDDLLISLFEDRMERINADLRASLVGAPDAAEKLLRVIRRHVELVETNRPMAEVICVELRQSSKFIKEYANPKFAEYLRLIAGAVADGQAAGELRADIEPQIFARALFGALDELALAWLVGGPKNDKSRADRDWLARAAEQLGRVFIDGLRPA